MKERNIKAEIKEKLHDPILSDNLARFAKQYPQARLKAYANVDDIDELRNELRDMKKQTVAHIEEVADKFQASLEERGAKVFRAKDGDELKAQLLQICKENNIHRIVKSKSMATEEIHLNHFLEQQGLRVKETDLGEWMLSVAGQKPSHMVMPAIHLNRKQCAKFFSDELKEDIPSDIPYMIQIARKVLREEFLKADINNDGVLSEEEYGNTKNALGFNNNTEIIFEQDSFVVKEEALGYLKADVSYSGFKSDNVSYNAYRTGTNVTSLDDELNYTLNLDKDFDGNITLQEAYEGESSIEQKVRDNLKALYLDSKSSIYDTAIGEKYFAQALNYILEIMDKGETLDKDKWDQIRKDNYLKLDGEYLRLDMELISTLDEELLKKLLQSFEDSSNSFSNSVSSLNKNETTQEFLNRTNMVNKETEIYG